MKIIKLFKNKYIVTSLVFILWLLFFDKNNMIDQFQRKQEYNKLDKKKKNENILLNSIIHSELDSNNSKSKLYNNIIDNKIDVNNMLNHMWGCTNIGNQIICIFVSYYMMTDIPSFLLIIYSISKLNNLIINIYYNIIRYREIKNDYDNYIEFISI